MAAALARLLKQHAGMLAVHLWAEEDFIVGTIQHRLNSLDMPMIDIGAFRFDVAQNLARHIVSPVAEKLHLARHLFLAPSLQPP